MEIHASKTAEAARSFLKNLIEKAPFVISKILTDNGKEFTDRFCPTGEREPTGKHLFDQECAEHSIEHRLIKPRKPQTNGMAERFNGRIKEIIQQTRFESAQQLEETLIKYLDIYNRLLQSMVKSCAVHMIRNQINPQFIWSAHGLQQTAWCSVK
jgi:transposase-like protein